MLPVWSPLPGTASALPDATGCISYRYNQLHFAVLSQILGLYAFLDISSLILTWYSSNQSRNWNIFCSPTQSSILSIIIHFLSEQLLVLRLLITLVPMLKSELSLHKDLVIPPKHAKYDQAKNYGHHVIVHLSLYRSYIHGFKINILREKKQRNWPGLLVFECQLLTWTWFWIETHWTVSEFEFFSIFS